MTDTYVFLAALIFLLIATTAIDVGINKSALPEKAQPIGAVATENVLSLFIFIGLAFLTQRWGWQIGRPLMIVLLSAAKLILSGISFLYQRRRPIAKSRWILVALGKYLSFAVLALICLPATYLPSGHIVLDRGYLVPALVFLPLFGAVYCFDAGLNRIFFGRLRWGWGICFGENALSMAALFALTFLLPLPWAQRVGILVSTAMLSVPKALFSTCTILILSRTQSVPLVRGLIAVTCKYLSFVAVYAGFFWLAGLDD